MDKKPPTFMATYMPREPPEASRETTSFLNSTWLLFFALHKFSNRAQLDLSGRESRSVSEGFQSQPARRSPQALARRLHQFRQSRRDSRRHYRQWISSVLESGKFTLARPRPPRKRVNNSPAQLRRAYQSLKQAPTVGSRATLFEEYVSTSLLDLPQRRLNWRPANNRLSFVTWNIETLIGLGKYETLASFVKSRDIDILMLQETKSTSSNEITSHGGKYLLSGTPTEPSAGVGFYVSPRCLPVVQDFLPFSGRLAALILRTQPLPTVLITVYAPSMLQDPHDDRVRKKLFWDSLPTIFDVLPSPAIYCLAGDFNARVQTDSLQEYSEYVGPAVFPHFGTLDPDSNYGKMLDFLIQHDYSRASSLHSRPSSRIITYKEISASPSANHNSPSTSDFAAIDHVLISRRHCHNILSTSSKFEWKPPWFHRHFPVHCVMTFDKFLPPKRPTVPKTSVPQTDADKIKYKEIILASPLLSTTHKLRGSPCTGSISVFTDGSCPNQLDVRPGNPAGWAFTFKKNFQWVDSFGPVGQNLSFTPIGSNNSGELQAVIEALDFIIRHPSKFTNLPIDIHTDSLLVYKIAHDLVTSSCHHELVAHLRQLLSLVSFRFDLSVLKIAGHSGHEGNERADALAARGVHSSSNIGRHHPPARQLLSQANLPILSGSLEQQSYLLLNTVLEASSQLTPADAVVYKKEYLSIATKSLIEDINNTSTLDTERLTKLRKAVKRRVKKDKDNLYVTISSRILKARRPNSGLL